ncbi:endopeptidase La [Spirochaeta dissipatitropha]
MKLFDRPLNKGDSDELPLLPSAEIIIFPHMVGPFFIAKDSGAESIDTAMNGDRRIVVVPQLHQADSKASPQDSLNPVGTVARIMQVMKLPNGSTRVLIEGERRVRLLDFIQNSGSPILVRTGDISDSPAPSNAGTLMKSIQTSFQELVGDNKRVNPEILKQVERADTPNKLVDLVAGHANIDRKKKLDLLNAEDTTYRLEETAIALDAEIEVQNLKRSISDRVKQRMERSQKEYYLNEQLKEINKELGKETPDDNGIHELEEALDNLQLPEEVNAKARKELKRLERMQPMAPEAGILRTYIEWIIDIPWLANDEPIPSIDDAQNILDNDHYDMDKPKQRILEYIAIQKLNPGVKGPILCFVGPPGTGKTSLGKSMARALGREFTRISLGGVRDEAEIRGHRRTYVGAMPGKIIQGLRRLKTVNPVFLLDEIDKISSDHRGDPASALLEVLDPEQNNSFMDHYLDVPYDLSKVVFLTTANSLHTIPHALRDRMEIIEVPGYTEYEKAKIAEKFLIPKQQQENGLDWASITFQSTALRTMINEYTMESGVRNLERHTAAVMRRIAREAVAEGYPERSAEEQFSFVVTPARVRKFLGKRTARRDLMVQEQRIGMALGMAWTEAGGTLLPVEVSLFPGKGDLTLTGNLGDVMKESARIAHTFLRSNSKHFAGLNVSLCEQDMHIHVPEGAIPKDGPSAGITMTMALLSALLETPLPCGWSMTGEITLTGRILPVGGIKEKVLAAHRNGIKAILLPTENQLDAEELPREIRQQTTFHFPATILEAVALLFPAE